MDKASDFGSEDCEFESRRGQNGKFSVCTSSQKKGLVDTVDVSTLSSLNLTPNVCQSMIIIPL